MVKLLNKIFLKGLKKVRKAVIQSYFISVNVSNQTSEASSGLKFIKSYKKKMVNE